MKIHGRLRTSIWTHPTSRSVWIIDQTLLPFSLEDRQIASLEQAVEAIRMMRVRGAPLIGVTAAYGVALAMREDSADAMLERALTALLASRPTAVNLAWALERMRASLQFIEPADRADIAWEEAERIARNDVATNQAISRHGLLLLKAMYEKLNRPLNILTHCNAGWIATVDWGTALAPVYLAHDLGYPVHVWVEETRPRNQGLLTAWELRAHGIPHTYIVDNAGGHFMQQGKVDIVLVGADRVSGQGDVANKIGTYQKALAAKDCEIPFYAAVPSSTIDWSLQDAFQEIPIEERHASEVRQIRGRSADGLTRDLMLVDAETPIANPGFDITPARLVTGIITERGVAAPPQLTTLFDRA
ncbi:MAG: S-methyl-5-thioribose-1-phosphate isomerase [Betaproteobacteria bacterium]|nr:S-methyl-5-thioribose-1-phosphate isomerase [Betaproteobacteria bacterium]